MGTGMGGAGRLASGCIQDIAAAGRKWPAAGSSAVARPLLLPMCRRHESLVILDVPFWAPLSYPWA